MFEQNYLNRKEKETVIALAGIVGKLRELSESMENVSLPDGMLKNLRTATTWSSKALGGMIDHLDDKEIIKIYLEVSKYNVVAVRTGEKAPEGKNYWVSEDDIFTIAEHSLQECLNCTWTGDEVKKCEFRKAMVRCEVPVVENIETCPYKY